MIFLMGGCGCCYLVVVMVLCVRDFFVSFVHFRVLVLCVVIVMFLCARDGLCVLFIFWTTGMIQQNTFVHVCIGWPILLYA